MSNDLTGSPASSHQVLSADWSFPENISSSQARATRPALVSGPNGQLHALWEQNARIFYSVRDNGQWSSPATVATGRQPSAGLDEQGALHVVFTNEFFFKDDIFFVVFDQGIWSLPIKVSKTTGASRLADLAIDHQGTVHAVWTDETPGYEVIYHGWFEETWLNEPIQNARGATPVLVADGQDPEGLHLAFQSSGIGVAAKDIYHLKGKIYEWTLPENVSISSETDSIDVALTLDSDNRVHMVWQEVEGDTSRVRYVKGNPSGWEYPEDVSVPGIDARQPAILATQGTQISVVWREGNTIVFRWRRGDVPNWHVPDPVIANDSGLADMVMEGGADGALYVAWSGAANGSERDIFSSRHAPLYQPKVFLPGIEVDH
ncbi:MAG: hypothetical protein U9R25_01100 [Chloroflexota bacterium]|nr:hypothetical protein [Chloroflexota bacterium]